MSEIKVIKHAAIHSADSVVEMPEWLPLASAKELKDLRSTANALRGNADSFIRKVDALLFRRKKALANKMKVE